jgi:hypothetical protein
MPSKKPKRFPIQLSAEEWDRANDLKDRIGAGSVAQVFRQGLRELEKVTV